MQCLVYIRNKEMVAMNGEKNDKNRGGELEAHL